MRPQFRMRLWLDNYTLATTEKGRHFILNMNITLRISLSLLQLELGTNFFALLEVQLDLPTLVIKLTMHVFKCDL